MNIKKYYLTKNFNTRRGEKINKVEKIVLTSSKYDGFDALRNRNLIERLKYNDNEYYSCHYILDKNMVLNIIPEREQAICTSNNEVDKFSISIMLCLDREGKYYKKQLYNLINLLKILISKYKLNREDIILEYDVNNSRRPVHIVDEPILLSELIDKVVEKKN